MATSDVEKVAGDGGGDQPDTQETQDTQDTENTEQNQAACDPATEDGAPVNEAGERPTHGANDDSSDATGDGKRKKKDNGKVDFPIANAQYRNADGAVVTAATTEAVTADDGTSSDVTKLLAVPRPIFDEGGEVDETTGKKPVLYAGWNHRKHNPLKKDDFVDEAEFVNFQAFTFRIKAAVFMEKAKVAEKRALRLKRFGNQVHRKLVDKIAKMREQLATFEKLAQDENIDIAGLDD